MSRATFVERMKSPRLVWWRQFVNDGKTELRSSHFCGRFPIGIE